MNNKNEPSVSVVIGAYNEESEIADTIQSILGQTFDDFEIVVVNDGSSDQTAEVVESFHDSRVRLVPLDKNQGLPSALNRGIEESRGNYIARADADERSLPFRIQRQSKILDSEPGIQAVSCWYRIVGQNNKQIVDVEIPSSREFTVDDLLENGPGVAHGSMMIRKEALLDVNGYREEFQLAQDYDLWLRMAYDFESPWLHIVPEVLYERKIDPKQLEKSDKQKLFANAAKSSINLRKRGYSDENILNNLSNNAKDIERESFTKHESKGMYHYLAGIRLLDQQQMWLARRQLLKAVLFAPFKLRPWYKLGLSFFPKKYREKITKYVREMN